MCAGVHPSYLWVKVGSTLDMIWMKFNINNEMTNNQNSKAVVQVTLNTVNVKPFFFFFV